PRPRRRPRPRPRRLRRRHLRRTIRSPLCPQMKSIRRNPRRGSALLAALIVIVILTFAAAGVLSYSLTTYRNSVRQSLLDQAKEVADSEMEFLFFQWKT